MGTREDLPIRLFRTAVILSAVLYAAAVTPLAGQQAPDTARVAPASSAPASSAQASSPSTTTQTGPRLSSRFQRFEPTLARSSAPATSSSAVAQNTIVISTLALVLIIIIVVLLLR